MHHFSSPFLNNYNISAKKTHQLDEFSKNTLGLNEYIAFYNHYKNKQHNSNAKSVHVDIMKQLAEKNNSYAMFELAKIYENGTYGIEKSEKDTFFAICLCIERNGLNYERQTKF